MVGYFYFISAVFLLRTLSCVHGSCFTGKLMAEMTVSKRLRYYCEYKQDNHVTRLLPGSRMVLSDDCIDCTCSMDGLQCCGIGHASGVIGHPEDCKILLDGCQPLLVKVNNESLDCFTGSVLNFTALSENVPHPDNVYTSEQTTMMKEKEVISSKNTVSSDQIWTPLKDGMFTMPLMEILQNQIKMDTAIKTNVNGLSLSPEIKTTTRDAAPQLPVVQGGSQTSNQPGGFDLFWPHDFFLPWYLL